MLVTCAGDIEDTCGLVTCVCFNILLLCTLSLSLPSTSLTNSSSNAALIAAATCYSTLHLPLIWAIGFRLTVTHHTFKISL